MPSHKSQRDLANTFNRFFISKIENIRAASTNDATSQSCLCPNVDVPVLEFFHPTTEDEIRKLVMSSPSKHCNLDPIPTWILKYHIDILLPAITNIVNLSLESSIFPQLFKSAMVKPLLKKPSLDPEIIKNYRPVLNLTFVSNIIEKVVAARLNEHLVSNNLLEKYQSAYRKFHGTETALLKVQNDIL